jgi:outer membrane lipoprotein-sorting protein
MTADFGQIKHTAVVDENSNSSGKIKIKKKPPAVILAWLEFTAPDPKTIIINDKIVDIYLPLIKTVQEADLGKHKDWVEQFLLLGFGTSRSDLERAYNVSLGGPEAINGEAATRLVMISKNPEVNRRISKFELWISDKSGEPVQQKFYEPSGDYNVFTYRDMKVNPNLSDSEMAKAPKGSFKKENLNK